MLFFSIEVPIVRNVWAFQGLVRVLKCLEHWGADARQCLRVLSRNPEH